MKLRPSACFYFALERAGVSLIVGLMFGSFFAATMPGHQPQPGDPFLDWAVLGFIAGVAALSFPCVLLYSWILARSYRIELRRDGLSVRYGIVGITDEVLPYRKIQDVVISRGLLERLMSLATLTIQNAVGRHQIIPCLSPQDAEILRDRLLAPAT